MSALLPGENPRLDRRRCVYLGLVEHREPGESSPLPAKKRLLEAMKKTRSLIDAERNVRFLQADR